MRGWAVHSPGPIASRPLQRIERAIPEPASNELLVHVDACGVCRTDMHLAEGDLAPHRPATIPGHEVVGRVSAHGSDVHRFQVGDRVGIAWLRHTCGTCVYCRRGQENLCRAPLFTGWDADGGYADYAVIDEAYAYAIPEQFDDAHAAPLLCAGIIGYRALKRADLPDGGRLGIYGFGASAHLTAQLAIAQGAEVHVLTRSEQAQQLALELGAGSAAGAYDEPPQQLDSAILFAPVGDLVPVALAALAPGGTLAIAGIHLSDVPRLSYQRHLFEERQVRSVTANTRQDGTEFLELAARLDVRPTVQEWPMEAADEALRALAEDQVSGAAVLVRISTD